MSNWRFAWTLIGWGMVLLTVYLSLTPKPPPLGIQVWDKFTHTLAYLALTYWFAQLHERRLAVALGMLALGGGLEIAQGYTGYRQASGLDMLANAIGVAAGWLLAWRLPNLLLWLETRRG
ncbi:MAG: hypothetical protein ACUVSD_02790 [Thiobacillaceae bacterium]